MFSAVAFLEGQARKTYESSVDLYEQYLVNSFAKAVKDACAGGSIHQRYHLEMVHPEWAINLTNTYNIDPQLYESSIELLSSFRSHQQVRRAEESWANDEELGLVVPEVAPPRSQ